MSVHDEYFGKQPHRLRMAAVTRPIFAGPIWALVCALPRPIRRLGIFDFMTCSCESCFEHATTVGQDHRLILKGYGFWHWTRSEPIS